MSARMIHMVTMSLVGHGMEAHIFATHDARDELYEGLLASVAAFGVHNVRISRKDFYVDFDATKEQIRAGVTRAMNRAVMHHAMSQLLGSLG